MKSFTAVVILSLLCSTAHVEAHNAKGFDDTVLFNLAWHGKDDLLTGMIGDEEITVTTTNKEKYKCIIPSIATKETEGEVQYNGPSPIDLLVPLFSHSTCSYRIESYWTYEVCHGNYIKQYHEERHEKTSKLQEYYLGKWDKQKTADLVALYKKAETDDEKLKYKKIDGLNLPYLEMEMDSGTVCDLNGEARVTKVLYVCYLHGKNEVYSLKETSTCNYEVIILTPMLCAHPKYKPQETEENKINCVALNDSPKKPKNLLMMEIESMRIKYQKLTGSGWWKFELCYNKHVRQFHDETSIYLGYFNKEKHLEWLEKNPAIRNKRKNENQLSNFYGGGDVCDKTSLPRQVEVKLKCTEHSASSNAIALYLLEPRPCEYILNVESSLICDILPYAEENMLLPESLQKLDEETLYIIDSSNVNN